MPVNLALVIAGLAVAFAVRRWLIEWVERHLEAATSRRSIAWLVALRNLTRLVVPAVGAGLFFAAFDPAGLLARTDQGRFFSLPPFVLVLIASGWLAGSLLAPAHKSFRLVPLDDDEAWEATRLHPGAWRRRVLLDAVLRAFRCAGTSRRPPSRCCSFRSVLVGAAALWRAAALINVARERIVASTAGDRPRFRDDNDLAALPVAAGPPAARGRGGGAAARCRRVHAGRGLPGVPQLP